MASHVIGIAGPSCSGKTSLAVALAGRLPGGAIVFATDAYYRDQSGVPEHAIDVDVPEALDEDFMMEQLRTLVTGRPIEQPIYDYTTHRRTRESRPIDPAPYVIVEGLFALYWDGLRALIDTGVFLAVEHDVCLARRIARDVRERGRTVDSITHRYQQKVRPMYERYVGPTRRHAHLVLDGREPIERLAEQLFRRVVQSRPRRKTAS